MAVVSLEDPTYVAQKINQWRCLPVDMWVIEYKGTGDPAFGGFADDRPLGKDGRIIEHRCHREADVAVFTTLEEAHQAAIKVPNRRPGSILGVAPRWR